jgi:hypothetical protein
VILCDTAPIVASALSTDDEHHACVELFTGMYLAGRDLPGTCSSAGESFDGFTSWAFTPPLPSRSPSIAEGARRPAGTADESPPA